MANVLFEAQSERFHLVWVKNLLGNSLVVEIKAGTFRSEGNALKHRAATVAILHLRIRLQVQHKNRVSSRELNIIPPILTVCPIRGPDRASMLQDSSSRRSTLNTKRRGIGGRFLFIILLLTNLSHLQSAVAQDFRQIFSPPRPSVPPRAVRSHSFRAFLPQRLSVVRAMRSDPCPFDLLSL
ncbi:hypothetical protein EVAR_410_1 [Eumeta japonica]|uniref:Uncharacterized protein n=1 Tax=Eumeta variegata TaxID=151549 RepID=A0A4C1SD83_EUMVA|nr:hypothetical protein EVAR_410_1 [Eumeta japonica]